MENNSSVSPAQDASGEDHDVTMGEQNEKLDESHDEDVTESLKEESNIVEEPDGEHDIPTAEESTFYSVFSNPPSLNTMRQRLFEIEDRIEMSMDDFEAYFPYIDNVWRKLRTGETQKETGVTTDWYWCRLKRGTNQRPHVSRTTSDGKQTRKKRAREDLTCNMALKVMYSEGSSRKCTIVRGVGESEKHTHDLDYMDSTKRNSGIMDVARREAIRGFLPTSVFWKMWGEHDEMIDAGGKFMKVSDVRNVQYPWRQEHPRIVLKAHAGYSQSRAGPRSRQSNASSTVQQISQPSPAPIIAAPSAGQVTEPIGPPPTLLHYPEDARGFLEPYLLDQRMHKMQNRAHITLTWASSLDSKIAIFPGVQTAISSPETKTMTHYLRSRHDAIVVGVGTALADDPSLNCRLAGGDGISGIPWQGQPRPIIIDPRARLKISPEMKLLKAVREGRAKGPWVIVSPEVVLQPQAVSTLKAHGGEFLMINDYYPRPKGLNWEGIFNVLFREGIRSIMIEGGGIVLSELLKIRYAHLIDSVIITIAPTFFGNGAVQVSPDMTVDDQGKPMLTRLKNVKWQPMGESDVVMCGHLRYEKVLQELRPSVPGQVPQSSTLAQVPERPTSKHVPQTSASGQTVLPPASSLVAQSSASEVEPKSSER